MRILAVSTGERLQAAPELPTMTELGYPMNLVSWWAAMVAATPRPIINQLNIWFSQVVAGDEGKNSSTVLRATLGSTSRMTLRAIGEAKRLRTGLNM